MVGPQARPHDLLGTKAQTRRLVRPAEGLFVLGQLKEGPSRERMIFAQGLLKDRDGPTMQTVCLIEMARVSLEYSEVAVVQAQVGMTRVEELLFNFYGVTGQT